VYSRPALVGGDAQTGRLGRRRILPELAAKIRWRPLVVVGRCHGPRRGREHKSRTHQPQRIPNRVPLRPEIRADREAHPPERGLDDVDPVPRAYSACANGSSRIFRCSSAIWPAGETRMAALYVRSPHRSAIPAATQIPDSRVATQSASLTGPGIGAASAPRRDTNEDRRFCRSGLPGSNQRPGFVVVTGGGGNEVDLLLPQRQMETGRRFNLGSTPLVQYHYCMKTITINVSEPVYREIRDYARSVDRSASEVIREAMEEFRDRRIRRRVSVRSIEPLALGGLRRPFSRDDDMLEEMLDDVRT